jgi:anaerobic selenocysteine-containing dehydrogenase
MIFLFYCEQRNLNVTKVTDDPESPTSRGYLCPKGAVSPDLLYHPDRLTHPLRRAGERGANRWERISWNDALDEMTTRLDTIRNESGSEYFGMMQGTGRPYSGYVARFAHAFGTPNITEPLHFCYLARSLPHAIHVANCPWPMSTVLAVTALPAC